MKRKRKQKGFDGEEVSTSKCKQLLGDWNCQKRSQHKTSNGRGRGGTIFRGSVKFFGLREKKLEENLARPEMMGKKKTSQGKRGTKHNRKRKRSNKREPVEVRKKTSDFQEKYRWDA